MQQSNLLKASVLAACCVGLSGCIGGGSDGSDGSESPDSGDTPENVGGGGGDDSTSTSPESEFSEVSGSFIKTTSAQGMSIKEAAQVGPDSALNFGTVTCGFGEGAERYYQTDLVRVFGDRDATDEQLERTAQGVHHFLKIVRDQMALQPGSVMSNINPVLARKFVTSYEPEGSENGWAHLETAFDSTLDQQVTIDYSSDAMSQLLDLSPEDFQSVVERTEQLDSNFNTLDSVMGTLDPYSGQSFPVRYDDARITACIDGDFDSDQTVDSTVKLWGFTAGREFTPKEMHHAIVHVVQMRMTGTSGASSNIPHWFGEGQAVHLSGEAVAGADTYDLLGEPFTTEGDYAHPQAEKHALYGLMYQYLAEKTPKEDLAGIIMDKFTWTDDPTQDPSPFEVSFDNVMKDPSGDALTLSTYESEFSTRMESYLSK